MSFTGQTDPVAGVFAVTAPPIAIRTRGPLRDAARAADTGGLDFLSSWQGTVVDSAG